MEPFNSNKFINSLKSGNIHFIANAISHLHAVAIDAFVWELSNNKNNLRGIIIVYPNPKDGFVINEDDFICNKFAEIDFYFFDDREKTTSVYNRMQKFLLDFLNTLLNIRKINKENIHLYLIFPKTSPSCLFKKIFRHKSLSSKYNPVIVQVEEGIGTYISKKMLKNINKDYMRMNILKNMPFQNIFLEIYYLRDDFIVNLEKNILLRNITKETRNLLKKKYDCFKVNDNVLRTYKEVLKLYDKNINIECKKSVLMLSDPLSEHGVISEREELKLIELIIQSVTKMGFQFLLKPHPRENVDKFNELSEKYIFNIVQNDLPVESILHSLNPPYVLGYWSTALINASILYEINSVSLLDILANTDGKIINRSIELKEIMREHVTFVKNFSDLEQLLSQKKVSNN